MKYMGSKSRVSKSIVPIIQNFIDTKGIDVYIEPFVGGANVIDKIKCKNKIGCDKQKYLISLFQNIEKIHSLPHDVTKTHYSQVRESYKNNFNSFENWYIGAIGFLASYNGRFFDGGYAGTVKTKSGSVRNYYNEALNNLQKQSEHLKGIEWKIGDYEVTCENISGALIYCDIPYYGTKQYDASKGFEYFRFWNWAEKMSRYNIVIVSEQNAPSNWECIWCQKIYRTMDNAKHIQSIERLFISKKCKFINN